MKSILLTIIKSITALAIFFSLAITFCGCASESIPPDTEIPFETFSANCSLKMPEGMSYEIDDEAGTCSIFFYETGSDYTNCLITMTISENEKKHFKNFHSEQHKLCINENAQKVGNNSYIYDYKAISGNENLYGACAYDDNGYLIYLRVQREIDENIVKDLLNSLSVNAK